MLHLLFFVLMCCFFAFFSTICCSSVPFLEFYRIFHLFNFLLKLKLFLLERENHRNVNAVVGSWITTKQWKKNMCWFGTTCEKNTSSAQAFSKTRKDIQSDDINVNMVINCDNGKLNMIANSYKFWMECVWWWKW